MTKKDYVIWIVILLPLLISTPVWLFFDVSVLTKFIDKLLAGSIFLNNINEYGKYTGFYKCLLIFQFILSPIQGFLVCFITKKNLSRTVFKKPWHMEVAVFGLPVLIYFALSIEAYREGSARNLIGFYDNPFIFIFLFVFLPSLSAILMALYLKTQFHNYFIKD
ncbi:hypothetical protein CWB73_16660 [Pseudoalteromonas phenolica]|uniref:Uncharacterized protein n=1 Tax=Pseudoalteromonas phenolica TaxID=161398 RepID=A0A5S3YQX1_9GAMM|nr:hypothetical protein [Pseudoalteromonas phenolica]TMP78444.1 hypothetical protein CWB73_16660 [Pseudoalteromonas phenolica]